MRKELFSQFGRTRGRSGATAVVVEGHGFVAVTARAFFSSIFLFSQTGFPHRMFDSIEAAVGWLMPRIAREGSPHPEELIQAVLEQTQ